MKLGVLVNLNRMINANLRSHFASSKFALEYMLEQKSGVILNISSATTTGVIPNINIYAMSGYSLFGNVRCRIGEPVTMLG